MTVLRIVLLILHFVGLAALLGGFLYQMSAPVKKLVPGMLHGALTQLVTGVALVGVAYGSGAGDSIDNIKITVKLLITLAIAIIVIAHRGREAVSTAVWASVGALTLANVVIAVAWR